VDAVDEQVEGGEAARQVAAPPPVVVLWSMLRILSLFSATFINFYQNLEFFLKTNLMIIFFSIIVV
jgi:hypothetical protein